MGNKLIRLSILPIQRNAAIIYTAMRKLVLEFEKKCCSIFEPNKKMRWETHGEELEQGTKKRKEAGWWWFNLLSFVRVTGVCMELKSVVSVSNKGATISEQGWRKLQKWSGGEEVRFRETSVRWVWGEEDECLMRARERHCWTFLLLQLRALPFLGFTVYKLSWLFTVNIFLFLFFLEHFQ